MTNEEILNELGTESPLNRARKTLYSGMARIEQAEAQHHQPSLFERRRMEFQVVREIAAELGVKL